MSGLICLYSGWTDESAALAHWSQLRQASITLSSSTFQWTDVAPSLLTIADAPSDFPDSARKRLSIQQDRSLAFWRCEAPPVPADVVAAESVGFLAKSESGLPERALVIRRSFAGGQIDLVFPLLVMTIDGNVLSVPLPEQGLTAPAPEHAKPRVRLALVSGWEIGGEAGSLISLIGMTALTANPPVGIALMIGGQILSFVFQQIARSKQPTSSVPSSVAMAAALKGALEDQHVSNLCDDAAALWSEVSSGYDQGWDDPDSAPSATAYNDFVSYLTEKLVPDSQHSPQVRDSNDKLAIQLNVTDGDGNYTGLQYIPSFLIAAGIEVLGLQLLILVHGAASKFGQGADAKLNYDYVDALQRGKDRTEALIGKAKAGFELGSSLVPSRIDRFSDVHDVNTHNDSTTGVQYFDWVFEDKSKYLTLFAEPQICGSYVKNLSCCGPNIDGCSMADAQAVRSQKITELMPKINAAFGIPNLKAQQDVVASWQKALDDIVKALSLRPTEHPP